MKVLFLNPPFFKRFSREQRSPAVTKSNTLYYPKWLATAAGVAIKNHHDVYFIDAPAQDYDLKKVIDFIENKNIEALICDTSTPSFNNDLNVVEQIKNRFNKMHTIMVGRPISTYGANTLKNNTFIDAVAIREYEYTVRDWLAALSCGSDLINVPGLIYRKNQEIVTNITRKPIANLDELPFVSEVYKRFLNIEDYFYGHSLHPLVVFDTSRGCPYRCSFCAYPQTFSGHTMRYRSVENVADEFDFVKKELPQVKTIMLEDDTFIVNKKRTELLADELIKRGNKIPFDSNCRADIGDDINLLSKLNKAGARLFCVGFESGDPDVIKGMSKNLNPKKNDTYHRDAISFVNTCKRAGIMVHGCFMFGNLDDTKESIQKTLDFAKKLDVDTAQFFPIMVYPGTESYNQAKEKGYLSSENPDDWLTKDGLHNSVVNLPNLTKEDLVNFADKARREFYLRPKYLIKKILQSFKSPNEFKRNLIGFKSLLKYLIKGSGVS